MLANKPTSWWTLISCRVESHSQLLLQLVFWHTQRFLHMQFRNLWWFKCKRSALQWLAHWNIFAFSNMSLFTCLCKKSNRKKNQVINNFKTQASFFVLKTANLQIAGYNGGTATEICGLLHVINRFQAWKELFHNLK